MGFLDDVFGKENSQKSSQKTDTNSRGSTLSTGVRQTGAAGTKQTGAKTAGLQSITSELDGASSSNIRNILSSLTNSQLVSQAGERAGSVDTVVGDLISGGLNTARREFERTTLPRLSQIGQAAGSELNSTVQILRNQADEDFAARMAEVQGRLGFEGRKLGTDEITAASNIQNQTASTAGGLAGILSNANRTVSNTGESQQVDNSVQKTTDALLNLGLEEKDILQLVEGNSSIKSGAGLLDILNVVANLAGAGKE